MAFKKISDRLIAETFEDARQYDLEKLCAELERLRGEVVEVKVKPDQETLDFWNNEATMRNESTQGRIAWIEDKLKAIKEAGLLVKEYDIVKVIKNGSL